MSARRRWLRPALVAVSLLAGLRAPAAGDDPRRKTDPVFLEQGDSLYVSHHVTSVFDAGAFERLEYGLPSTVVIRLWMYPVGKARQIGFVLLHRTCVYDLWDEIYECAVAGPTGRHNYKVKFRGEALTMLTAFERVPIARLADLVDGERYEVAVVAELNPVSKETLAEVRRWLSQGSGGGLDRGGSFFGSFVSVFANLKLPEADRVVKLRFPVTRAKR